LQDEGKTAEWIRLKQEWNKKHPKHKIVDVKTYDEVRRENEAKRKNPEQ
jgi:hypothetical protein